MGCEHKQKWRKKIYTHGYNSQPYLVCKKCGEVLKRYELMRKAGVRKR